MPELLTLDLQDSRNRDKRVIFLKCVHMIVCSFYVYANFMTIWYLVVIQDKKSSMEILFDHLHSCDKKVK